MRDFANPAWNESVGEDRGAGTAELDPYASIRPAMSAEHAGLPANEVTLILGRMPATLVLHQLLHSPQMRRATLASLLGKAARRSVRFNGSDVSTAAYLRMVSRLCREVAEQTEAPASEFETPGTGVFELEEENQLGEEACTGIIGDDNRVPVSQAWDIPYRWIVQISARQVKGGKQQKFAPAGTGILISPRFVLTAAHILRSSKKDERGQWVDSEAEYVVVTPARNEDAGGNKAPFGQFEARRWNLCPKYNPRAADARKHDYAVIELKEPAGAKRAPVLSNALLCFWGSRECGGNTNLEFLDAKQLAGKTAYTAGYPADRGDGTRLFSTTGMLSNVDIPGRLEIMNYDADGCPGQSGSPIWIERDGKRYLAGIFTEVGTVTDGTTGRVLANEAVRLTQGVLDQISRWLEAVMETPWLDNRESSAESIDEAEMMEYDTPVIVERDTPKTSVRQVAVGQRVELDVGQGASGADLEQVRWTIPGRVVRGYEGTASEAKLLELTRADLERPKISFFWVDAGSDRAVRAKIRRKSGAVEEFVAVFDVEGPKMAAFTGKPGVTRIVKEHGTVGMQFGKPFEAPGVEWKWKITMPPHHGGFVKDVQTVLTDRSKIQSLAPGGTKTRSLVWRHPSNPKPHVQLDGDSDNQAIYTTGLDEERREAGTSFDTGSGRGLSDSPHIGLDSLDRTVSANDQFTYYVLFKPETDKPQDAIFVPVARATWAWNATADQQDKNWSLRNSPKMVPAIDMATTDFPIYQSNGAENEWQDASPAASHELFAEYEAAGYESGERPYAYDMPEQEAWPTPPLEHDLFEGQVSGGGGVAHWAAGIDPFPAAPALKFELADPDMVAAFAPVTTGRVKHLCAAVVDLTGDPATPPYAGLNDQEMVFVGSMLKIAAMYAAFALRSQVQAFVDAARANGASVVPPGITGEIEKAWKPKLRAGFPSLSEESFRNRQDITFPQLEKIFTFSSTGKVEFRRASPAMADADLDRAGELGSPEGSFHDWMRLMLRWSNNVAASKCILALGYFYINGALAQAGFFQSSNGLWLSADYQRHDWVKTLAEKNANAAGPPLTPRWAKAQGRRRSNITATAAQTARFMTLLAQGKLVDATASREMRTLMQSAIACAPHASCGIGSYVKDALAGRSLTTLAAKKGYGDECFSHECAIVERTVGHKDLRYVVVGLGSDPSQSRRDLSELFVSLDDVIVNRNLHARHRP